MKVGDLVYVHHYSIKKYCLVKGWDMSSFRRKYYILIDTKTGEIIEAYDYNVKLVCAS